MLDKFRKHIGSKYKKIDEKGNYFGCFEPAYYIFPNLPRYKLPEDNSSNFDFSLEKLETIAKKIIKENLNHGDIIAFKLPRNVFHIGVYIGDGKMVQTFAQNSMHISRINFDNHRIIGFYRINKEFSN